MKEKLLEGTKKVVSLTICFLLSMFIVAPLVGVITEFLGIKWSWVIWGITMIISGLATYGFSKTNFLKINTFTELIIIIVLGVFSGGIYIFYSPTFEIHQDPSLYAYKAFNLVNYGTTYQQYDIYEKLQNDGIIKDDEAYAAIQNGTSYLNGKLYIDFYPGSAFFYAMIGKVAKSYMMYGQTIIMILIAIVLYEILKKFTKGRNLVGNAVATCGFMCAPLIVFFGRASYSEPTALLFMLLAVTMFQNLEDGGHQEWLLSLILLGAYTARIDYVLLIMVGIVVLCFQNIRVAMITTVFAAIEAFIESKVYWLYYNRITAIDMPILKYSIVLLVFSLIVGVLIKKYWKEFEDFYRCQFITVVLVIVGVALVLLIFRENITSDYQMAEIHGQIMRTYSEEILDLLCLVFPSIAILLGMLGLYKIPKDDKVGFLSGIFIMGIFCAYAYFLLKAGNSPQLYWMLRRYYNVIIPVLFISFVILLKDIPKHLNIIIMFVFFVTSANMFWNSGQIVNYQNLDKCIYAIDDILTNQGVDVVLYDERDRYICSSLMSVSRKQCIPVNKENFRKISRWLEENGYHGVFLTTQEFCEYDTEQYKIKYTVQGEEYGDIPQKHYKKKYTLYQYAIDKDSRNQYIQQYENGVYLSQDTENASGDIYDDGWIGSNLEIADVNYFTDKGSEIHLQRYGYNHYYLDRSQMDITLILNNTIELDNYTVDENDIIFECPDNIKINDIKVVCNSTYIPREVTGENDGRELGLDLHRIYFTNKNEDSQ